MENNIDPHYPYTSKVLEINDEELARILDNCFKEHKDEIAEKGAREWALSLCKRPLEHIDVFIEE
jgi:hypothetical protein